MFSPDRAVSSFQAIGYNGHLVARADLKSHIYKVSFLLGSYLDIEPKSKKRIDLFELGECFHEDEVMAVSGIKEFPDLPSPLANDVWWISY